MSKHKETQKFLTALFGEKPDLSDEPAEGDEPDTAALRRLTRRIFSRA